MHSKLNKIEEKLKLLEQTFECFSTLDYKITTGELQKAFSKLKSGKSPGLDNVQYSFGLSDSKISIRSNIFCLNSLLFSPSILHIFCYD
jgi:hypothetical protein